MPVSKLYEQSELLYDHGYYTQAAALFKKCKNTSYAEKAHTRLIASRIEARHFDKAALEIDEFRSLYTSSGHLHYIKHLERQTENINRGWLTWRNTSAFIAGCIVSGRVANQLRLEGKIK